MYTISWCHSHGRIPSGGAVNDSIAIGKGIDGVVHIYIWAEQGAKIKSMMNS